MLHACTPQSCFEETDAFVKASFYKEETGAIAPPDSLTLYGIDMESSRLYNKGSKIQPALFPLNAATGISIFIIRINGISDTLTFTYTSYPHLISKECGYAFYHTIDTPVVTKNLIKSVTLMKNNITTLNEENIRINY
jgi:hypothetical protein